MAGPFHLKNLHYPLQVPPSSSSSSSSSSTKMLKTIIQTLFYTQFVRLVRALAKFKSILIHTLKELNQPLHFIYQAKATKKQRKLIFGSFRLHYNWCSSSHVVPIINNPPPTTSSVIIDDGAGGTGSELSTYLQWLEDRKTTTSEHEMSYGGDTAAAAAADIDRLAEMFIANCHEKFLLEKQESYRRFQEMLARSV